MSKKILITETILRDGHQSQAATRMTTAEMLPALEKMDRAGFFSIECWGGATYDSCLRFLNEDPWDRLKMLKEGLPKTKLQMLLRGQNLLGYKHYADDVVDLFIKKSIENGIDIIRIFDALNDTRNLLQSIKSIKKYGGICEAAFSYTVSPVHNIEYFVKLSKKFSEMGADIICIKDMANILLPFDAYELVRAIKAETNLPVHIHTHNTAGTGDMVYLKAIEAGADIIDTSLSPLGNGTSQPTTEALVATLKNTEFDTKIDLSLLNDIASHFNTVAERLSNDGFLNSKVLKTDVKSLIYQVPGGMLSNLLNQLKEQGALDRFEEVLKEVPLVRKDLGYPPLVTPTSQIVGTQAVLNTVLGERYKIISKETKALISGKYGQLPSAPDKVLLDKCLEGAEPVVCRPADLLEPELEKYKKEMETYYTKEEDLLSYCLFPQVAIKFFIWRQQQHIRKFKVRVGENDYCVVVEDMDYIKKEEAVERTETKKDTDKTVIIDKKNSNTEENGQGFNINSPMPGDIMELKFQNGQKVKKGDVILVIEAMKMETDISASIDGIINYKVQKSAQVNTGDVLATII